MKKTRKKIQHRDKEKKGRRNEREVNWAARDKELDRKKNIEKK